MKNNIIQSLSRFAPITLEEMQHIRLMNRTDTKYLTTLPALEELLFLAQKQYRIQEIGNDRNMPYYTLYYDTPALDMFRAHQNGKLSRQKIRTRSYVNSGHTFLEIKNKNNKGRTDKRRIRIPSVEIRPEACRDFLSGVTRYPAESLSGQLENRFNRITLVNRQMTERLTIDTELRFHNLRNDNRRTLEQLVIIEQKRDGNTPSPIREILRTLRIHPAGFSKYCMGTILTDNTLKHNRLKPRLHALEHLLSY